MLFLRLPEQEIEALVQGSGAHVQLLNHEFFGLHFRVDPQDFAAFQRLLYQAFLADSIGSRDQGHAGVLFFGQPPQTGNLLNLFLSKCKLHSIDKELYIKNKLIPINLSAVMQR